MVPVMSKLINTLRKITAYAFYDCRDIDDVKGKEEAKEKAKAKEEDSGKEEVEEKRKEEEEVVEEEVEEEEEEDEEDEKERGEEAKEREMYDTSCCQQVLDHQVAFTNVRCLQLNIHQQQDL
jgi:hypothetical protein